MAPESAPTSTGKVVALALVVMWLLVLLGVWLSGLNASALTWLLALAVPSGLLALGGMMMDIGRELAAARGDLTVLRKEVAALRSAETAAGSVAKRLDDLARASTKSEMSTARFATSRATPTRPTTITSVTPVYTDQSTLELGTNPEPEVLPTDDLIRAMNFPEHDLDEVGFASLRRALKDPTVGRLVKASQDVLTLLSQDGIYMDDLTPDRARPEIWRRFAQGERGRAVAALGGVRDRSSLALSAGRMRQDVIFRDAAHHFLRLFDRTLMTLEPSLSDADLVALSDTRTARAFMLLGRVNGAFS